MNDSIVIPRADLPLVEERGGAYWIGGYRYVDAPGAGWFRAEALRLLALAEYLDARPLAVGDRVRVVRPEHSDGRSESLAVGDVGTVEVANPRNAWIIRDGTTESHAISPANVERIEEIPDGAVTAREWHAPDFTKETNR